jgi:ribosomal protein L37AE/L43A
LIREGSTASVTKTGRAIAYGFVRRYHAFPMKRKLGLFVYTEERNCPLCSSDHVHRTKRGRLLEFWVLLFLPYRPYRCGKCRQRFYGPRNLPKREVLEEVDEAEELDKV